MSKKKISSYQIYLAQDRLFKRVAEIDPALEPWYMSLIQHTNLPPAFSLMMRSGLLNPREFATRFLAAYEDAVLLEEPKQSGGEKKFLELTLTGTLKGYAVSPTYKIDLGWVSVATED